MATPAEIRNARKASLRLVRASLRKVDSQLELLERRIIRVLRVRKRFPDETDAEMLLSGLRVLDGLLDQVVSDASSFSQLVRTF